MPYELSDPNASAANEIVITNADLIWEDVAAQPGFSSEALKPGTWTPVEYGDLAPLVSRDHTYQSLRGLVKAGHEVFGVVEVMGKDIEGVQTMVTRIAKTPGDRATLVGFVDKEKGLLVGRTGDDSDGRLSREHFMIGFTAEGELAAKDLHSSNGTEIIVQSGDIETPSAETAVPADDDLKGKVFLKATKNLLRKRRIETQTKDVHNPLRDWNIWSVKTATVRAESPKANRERNEWLEAQLNDPENPLPKVGLKKLDSAKEIDALQERYHVTNSLAANHNDVRSVYEVSNTDGETIGIVKMVDPYSDAKRPKQHYIEFIKIGVNQRGKGYGPATYLEVLKSLPSGVGLKSDTVLSIDGKKAWERLVQKGVAIRIEGEYKGPPRYETLF